MKSILFTFMLCSLIVNIAISCSNICPQPECSGILDYSGCTAEQTGGDIIIEGDSGVCAACASTCGWVGYIDDAYTVSNFWLPGHQASAEIDSGYEIVQNSIALNPEAGMAILHIGGNDLRVAVVRQQTMPAEPECALTAELLNSMNGVIDMIMDIAAVYDAAGIHPVIASIHQVGEEDSNKLGQCASLFSDPGCLNEMLGLYNDALRLASEAHGYGFLPFYDAYADPAECSDNCECLHANCEGHEKQGQIVIDYLNWRGQRYGG